MEISEVRVKLVENSTERLRAFCSITLDSDFVIRDLKIIEGTNGAFVAMPSRKLADRCSRCGNKNHLRAKYCNECGQKLREGRAPKDAQGRAKLHADIAHPINTQCRERIQKAVIEAFEAELKRSQEPGYKPMNLDEFEEDLDVDLVAPKAAPPVVEPDEENEDEENEHEETSSMSRSDDADEKADLSDYDALIADLKRDAETRFKKQRDSRYGNERSPGRRSDEQPKESELSPLAGPSDGYPAAEARKDEGDKPAADSKRGSLETAAPAKIEERTAGSADLDPAPRPKQPDDFGAGLF